MKRRIVSVALALCLCIFSQSVVHASQENSLPQEDVYTEESTSGPVVRESTVPAPWEVYEAMIALKDQDAYKEGTTWTNDEPYSDTTGYYHWNGGPLDGANISAAGCVAFAFVLSDTAFGSLQARMYAEGQFSFEDIKVGDILRVNNDTHTVIVLEVSTVGVAVAEGNYNSTVHWGRTMSKEEVMRATSHYITRYPEGYIAPDDPSANEIIASETLDGGVTWKLTKAGTLTLSGQGIMPDFDSAEDQPWGAYRSQIRQVVIEDGITSIGSCAFQNCGVFSAEIPSSVTAIGSSAFHGSSIISVSIPSSVTVIRDSAFRACRNLTWIELPASIEEMGDAVFMECDAMRSAVFAPGSKQVKLGDNLFIRCYNLVSVTLPQSIDRIGEGMFQDCLMLAGVEIPQGAASIGGSAFASSGVSVVIIPDSVESIGIAAFASCPLSDIYFTGTETQWNGINKMGDTASAVSKATIHYEYSPELPDNPPKPDNPESPEDPSVPDNPEVPDNPSTPDTPEVPDNPSTPDTPEVPDNPSTPDTPEVPDNPSSPDNPETPDSPSLPDNSETSSGSSSTNRPEPPSGQAPTTDSDQATASTTPPEPAADSARRPSQTTASTEKPKSTGITDSSTVPATESAQVSNPAPSPTPGAQLPFIKGESGKEGWEAVRETAANAVEGEWIEINMNGTSTVPGYVFDSIKGQNVRISFDMGNGMIWLINGKDVTADHVSDVDLFIEAGTSAIPQNIVDDVAGRCPTMQISLAHAGDFGYSAVLMIYVDSANAGLHANLFYYNESAGQLEFVTSGQINQDGIAELTFTHASDYVIVVNEESMDESSALVSSVNNSGFDVVESENEGGSQSFMWLALAGVFGIAIVAGIILFRKNKRVNK